MEESSQLIQPLIDSAEHIQQQMAVMLHHPGELSEQDLDDLEHIVDSARQLAEMLRQMQLLDFAMWDHRRHHDLRARLNGIVGFSGLLKDSAQLTDDQRRAVMVVQTEGRLLADRMSEIFDNIT